jgi:hypothetical protein
MSHSPDDPTSPHWLKTKVSGWFWSLTPTCREVARFTSEGRDRPLPIGTRLRLGLHRSFCQWCARYARQLDLVHEASELFPEHSDHLDEPSLDGGAKERMKRALQQQQKQSQRD